MSVAINSITAIKAGCCPHGLPHGACPVCSGMGGGSQKVATADFSAKPGEMSWNECAAIGAFLKSLKNARMARETDYQNQIIAMAQFQNNMAKMSKNLQNFINNMNQSPLTRPLAVIAQNIVLPVVKFMKDLPVNFLKMTANIQQKLTDITDKLTAIYGEMKAAINKKISDLSKNIKKKLKSIFEIFYTDNEGSDDEKIKDYQKQLNRLKSFLEKIGEKLTSDVENEINNEELKGLA